MADDRHYVPGDYYVIDDLRGYKVRASRALLQWDNQLTIPESFSPRQPQDLVTGVYDDQSVPLPRPRQKNQFIIVGTSVVAPSPRGATQITVDSADGFFVGALVQVMLDSGTNFQFTIGAIDGDTFLWFDAGLPATVGTFYGDPIENSVLLIGVSTAAEDAVVLEDGSGAWLFEDSSIMDWG